MTKHLTLALLTTLSFAALASAQDVLTLDDAIALGLAHNRTVANAALETNKADEDIAIARSHRLPSFKIQAQGSQLLRPVDVTFARGAFGTFAGIGPVPATDTNITTPARFSFVFDAQVQQPLTQLFKINLNVKLTEATREMDREQLRDTRLGLVDQIRRVYYAMSQTGSALDANTQTLAMLHEIDRVVARKVSQQIALSADGLTVQSRIAQAELTELTLRHRLATQKEQLNQLLGRDLRTAFDVEAVPAPSFEEIDLEVAQARALAERPDVKEARIKVQQADIARKIAATDAIPDVGLVVSYLSPINIDGAPRQIATAAVQAQWEPWDWGRRRRTVASKAVAVTQAHNNLTDVEQRALVEINSGFRRLQEARFGLRAARAAQDSARENVRVRTTQYTVEAALLTDVLQTQSSLADSDDQYQQALVSFWTARADFARARGEETR